MSEIRQPKKRSRVALSCNYCKKRKVKCDRGKPCSSCIRYKVPNLCEYPEPSFAESGDTTGAPDTRRHERDPPNNIGMLPTFLIQKLNERSKPEPKRVQTKLVYHPQPQMHSQPQVQPQPSTHAYHVSPPQTGPAIGTGHAPPSFLVYPAEQEASTPGLQTELEMLKEKIKTIEASLNKKDVDEDRPVVASPQLNVFTPSPYPYQGSPSHIAATPGPLPSSAVATPVAYPSYVPTSSTVAPRLNYPVYRSNLPIQLPPISLPYQQQESDTCEKKPDKDNAYSEAAKIYVAVNPYASEDDVLDFYEGYNPIHIKDASRRMNFGPFAWLTLMKKDCGLLALWKFMWSSKFENMRPSKQKKDALYSTMYTFRPMQGTEEEVSDENEAEAEFKKRAIDRDGYNDLRYYDKNSKSKKTKASKENSIQLLRSAMNKNAISLGLTLYEGQIDQELQLIEKIKLILPKKRVIWTLISKFFLKVYPHMPFVDETNFKTEMVRILGPESYEDEKLESLKVERRLDFAHLGILLVVLRVTYVSLFSNKNVDNETNMKTNDPSPKRQELKYLLLNPINIDIVDMAQLCLDQFELLRKTNLVVLQCAIFMRCYHMYSPENGDGADGGDSQIFNGILTQMAYSVGINREPDLFEDLEKEGRTNNLGRKIWFFILMSDLSQAFKYGNPLSINGKYYDTKLPYFKPEFSNVSDSKLEEQVVKSFHCMSEYYDKILPLMEMSLDVKNPSKLKYILAGISDLELYMSESFPPLRKFAKPYDAQIWNYSFYKVLTCRNVMSMETFLLTVLFHVYLFYEKKKEYNLAFFYLKKVMAISCVELIPSFCPLILSNVVNFGEGADMVLNPTIQSAIHRVCQLIVAILVRVNGVIYKMKHDPEHQENLRTDFQYKSKFSKLCRYSKDQEKLMKFCMVAMSRLSQRYYYAWRFTKANTFFLKLIISEDFYKSLGKDEITLIPFTLDQLDELISMSETTLRKYGKNAKIFHAASDLLDDINDEDLEIKSRKNAGNVTPVSGSSKSAKTKHQSSSRSGMKNSVSSVSSTHSPYNNSIGLTSNYPSSVDSANNSEIEEFHFIENADIDRLWLQMANMKNDNTTGNGDYDYGIQDGNNQEGALGANSMVFNPTQMMPTPVLNPLSPDSLNNLKNRPNGQNEQGDDYQLNFPMTSHDIFNNFPIDQLLGIDGVTDSW